MDEIGKRLAKSKARIARLGGIVLIHHGPEGGHSYQLPDGREVSPNVVSQLRSAGHLRSGHDGLFGGDEQTLHLVQP